MLSRVLFIVITALLGAIHAEAFTCTTTGRFQNTFDPTCRTYYLCSNNEGRITSTLYKCQKTFDPTANECSNDYVCAKEPFSCAAAGYFPDLSDNDCISYYNCFNFFGFYIKFSHSCAPGYQFDPTKRLCSSGYKCENYLLAPEEPKPAASLALISDTVHDTLENQEFVCTETGLFADRLDKNCSAYFYCIPMSGGKFTKKEYRCRKYFDPNTKLCTDSYICPYEESIVQIGINIFEDPIENGSENVGSTTETPILTEIIDNETDNVITTDALEKSDTSPDFEVEDEVKRTTNTIIETTVGNIIATEVEENYKVIVSKESTASTAEQYREDTMETTIKGDGESLEISAETTAKSEIPIVTDIINNDDMKSDSADTSETTIQTEISMNTQNIDIQNNYVSENSDTPLVTGDAIEYTSEPYAATETNKEDLNILHSSTISLITADTIQPVEDISITEATTLTTLEDFVCESVGRFPDFSDSDCIRYFLCSKLRSGSFLKTSYKCPAGSNFDPISTKCSKTYQCHLTTEPYSTTIENEIIASEESYSENHTTEAEVTMLEETTQSSTTANEQTTLEQTQNEGTTKRSEEFICTTSGKYPNLDDQTCTTYYLCSRRQDGTFLKTLYNCQGSFFDPKLKRCSNDYKCPFMEIPTQPPTVWDFSCSQIGRFKNENDLGCKSYFLCSQYRNGTFVKTKYNCPKTSIFNSIKHICSDIISCVY